MLKKLNKIGIFVSMVGAFFIALRTCQLPLFNYDWVQAYIAPHIIQTGWVLIFVGLLLQLLAPEK